MQLFWNKNSRNVYNSGPMTLTSVAESLAVDLPIAVWKLRSVVGWDSNNQSFACKENGLTDYANTD